MGYPLVLAGTPYIQDSRGAYIWDEIKYTSNIFSKCWSCHLMIRMVRRIIFILKWQKIIKSLFFLIITSYVSGFFRLQIENDSNHVVILLLFLVLSTGKFSKILMIPSWIKWSYELEPGKSDFDLIKWYKCLGWIGWRRWGSKEKSKMILKFWVLVCKKTDDPNRPRKVSRRK
jgi:hypothetical protein